MPQEPTPSHAASPTTQAWHASTWLQQQLHHALAQHSSDIHLDSTAHGWSWRLRIHGQLQQQATLTLAQGQAVLACIKVKAQLDITEHRRPQEGRFQLHHHQQLMHARVTLCPCFWGEKASIRLHYGSAHLRQIDQLGMDSAQQQQLTQALLHSHGLIMACGPTGSGKSHTLNVGMQALAQQGKHCLSLEDPVEMPIPGVNHINIQSHLGLGYAQGLKSCLRMDPDVILIGEIRDHETAQLTIHAAQSGHLILGTVHSAHLMGVFDRMRQLGIAEATLAPLCRLFINQRLVPLLCSDCKIPMKSESYNRYQAKAAHNATSGSWDGKGCLNVGRLLHARTHPLGTARITATHQTTPIHSQAQKLCQQRLMRCSKPTCNPINTAPNAQSEANMQHIYTTQ